MRLYYAPGSCALSPHIVVRELGLAVEIEKVISAEGKKTTEPHNENYFDVNPRGYVPALRIESGDIMTEGSVIIQYLASLAPEKGLTPAPGTREYFRMLEWLTFISMELHKNFGPAFRKDLSDEERAKAIDKLKGRIAWVEKALEGNEYLLGSTFTIADAYCFTILRWHPRAGINLADFPNVKKYYDKIGARSAVAQAMEEEGVKMY